MSKQELKKYAKKQKRIFIGSITLVPYRTSDAKVLLGMLDREVCEQIGWDQPKNLRALQFFLKNKVSLFWVLYADKRAVGCIFLNLKISETTAWKKRAANLGYFIDRTHRNKGYASLAVSAIVDFAFNKLGIVRMIAGCLVHNTYSKRVIEKNGFRLIGIERKYTMVKSLGTYVNHYLFDKVIIHS
ncbi:MAG: GNAT family N-acetyltransferase [Patescibacteria group bacterium]|jgi:RimJ/RimL family protein N-acetyltransferase